MLVQTINPHDAKLKSSYCRFFLNCAQDSGDLVNGAVGGMVATKYSLFTDAACWATPGYATVGGSANNYAALSAADGNLNLLDGTVILTARMRKVAAAFPGAEQYWYAGYRPGTTTGGVILTMHTTGAVRLYITSTDGSQISVSSAANTYSDGTTATELGLVAIIDRAAAGSAYLIVNGLTETSTAKGVIDGKSTNGGTIPRIGVSQASVAADALRVRALAGYVVPRDVAQLDRRLIADWHQRNPHLQIPDGVFGL